MARMALDIQDALFRYGSAAIAGGVQRWGWDGAATWGWLSTIGIFAGGIVASMMGGPMLRTLGEGAAASAASTAGWVVAEMTVFEAPTPTPSRVRGRTTSRRIANQPARRALSAGRVAPHYSQPVQVGDEEFLVSRN